MKKLVAWLSCIFMTYGLTACVVCPFYGLAWGADAVFATATSGILGVFAWVAMLAIYENHWHVPTMLEDENEPG